ncbi:MAG: hypothetical protein JOZ69_16685, partial [Myxococcales bacterium]|nr:hypothetical protein [Myxococcales bacterium]
GGIAVTTPGADAGNGGTFVFEDAGRSGGRDASQDRNPGSFGVDGAADGGADAGAGGDAQPGGDAQAGEDVQAGEDAQAAGEDAGEVEGTD